MSEVPNRTKVVRLIIVPETVNSKDAAAVNRLVAAEGAARTDVFIVKDETKGWHPMSLLGDQLVDHDEAVKKDRDRETTVFAMVTEREQIQWESSVEFWLSSIRQKHDVPGFNSTKGAPADPFDGRPLKGRGGPGKPIRSGAATLNGGRQYDQLYKVSFVMMIGGREVKIDPDIYCDWQRN